MSLFDTLVSELLGIEGGYANDPADSGGETNWGVTVATARRYGYAGPMRDMTREHAKAIYKSRYWTDPGFEAVAGMAPEVAAELFDTGVNAGVGAAAAFLQRCLNVLNRNGADYADIATDGDIGPGTLRALHGYVLKRGTEGQIILVRMLNCLQGAFYIELAERRQKDERFVYGWIRTRVR